MLKGKIVEVFASIQGEGTYQGTQQVFVRFFGCNLHCQFCDTPLKDFKEYSVDELSAEIDSLWRDCHSVSFTGGEPLLQVDFLREILSLCKKQGRKTYLETNGILPAALERVIDVVDIVAMDFKLPSSAAAGNLWQLHERFLKELAKKEVMVKAVICNSTQDRDIFTAVEILKRIDPAIPFILQPNFFDTFGDKPPVPVCRQVGLSLGNQSRRPKGLVALSVNTEDTPHRTRNYRKQTPRPALGVSECVEAGETLSRKLSVYRQYCSKYLFDVRVLPQLHKILSLR